MNWLKATINGIQMEIRDRGAGEPIVFVHGSMGDELMAVLEEPALRQGFRVIDYHRRGFGGSACPEMPVSIAQQSADCQAVMRHLDIHRAHLSGQSYGGVISLQVALDAPQMVHSLALLEPALPSLMFGTPEFDDLAASVGARYQAGDKVGAVDGFGKGVCGEGYFDAFNRSLPPGWFERWVVDLDTVMQSDMTALPQWCFKEADAARIKVPVLNMRGEHTVSYMRDIYERMRAWLPQAENQVLADATHAMTQTNPRGAAERQARFFAAHPMEMRRAA